MMLRAGRFSAAVILSAVGVFAPTAARATEVVVFKVLDDSCVTADGDELASAEVDVEPINDELVLASAVDVLPLLDFDGEKLQEMRGTAAGNLGRAVADLTQYFRASVASDGAGLADALAMLELVEVAYVDLDPILVPGDLTPIPCPLDDYRSTQTNLDSPPTGLGVDDVQQSSGHRGDGITIVDIEHCWIPEHEDLQEAVGDDRLSRLGPMWWVDDSPFDPDSEPECPDRTFVSNPMPGTLFRASHGTADLGVLVADEDGVGIDGIAPQATVMFRTDEPEGEPRNIAAAIIQAALPVGDGGGGAHVILLELCVGSALRPCALDTNADTVIDKWDFLPIELRRAEFDAIVTAVGNGVHVVEAACNADDDLDGFFNEGDCFAGTRLFHYTDKDSGAIFVGAGTGDAPAERWEEGGNENPPLGSNHGGRVDVYARGTGIVTPGYGLEAECVDPPDPPDFRQDWTSTFRATSAASSQIAGCVALLVEAHSDPYFPRALRLLLRTSGSLPEDGAEIGRQPNLVDQIDIIQMGPQPAHVFTGFEPDPLTTSPQNRNLLNRGPYGSVLCGIEDVNDDGVRDLIVGAPSQDIDSHVDVGAVYIFSGMTGDLIRSHVGTVTSGHFGTAIASGDVTGDGTDDYAISSPPTGKVFVFNGATGSEVSFSPLDANSTTIQFGAALAIGDFGSTGVGDANHADIVVGAPTANVPQTGRVKVFSGHDGSSMFTLDGASSFERLGDSVAVGDLNADGKADFVAGAPNFSSEKGRIRAFTRASGSFAAISALDGLEGASSGAKFGKGLATLNMDGDGDDEIAVGAPKDDPAAGTDFGVVRVFNESSSTPIRTINGTVQDKRFGERLAKVVFDDDWGLGGGQGQFAMKEDLIIASPGEGKVRVFTLASDTTPAQIYTGQDSGSELVPVRKVASADDSSQSSLFSEEAWSRARRSRHAGDGRGSDHRVMRAQVSTPGRRGGVVGASA